MTDPAPPTAPSDDTPRPPPALAPAAPPPDADPARDRGLNGTTINGATGPIGIPRPGRAGLNGHRAGGFSLFGLLRGRTEQNSWRDTIEELIEDGEESHDAASEDADATDALERHLLANILRLRDRTAYDAMVPRADIVAIATDTSRDDLIEILVDKPHSRLPIYRDTLDDVIGMVHIKDVIIALAQGHTIDLADLRRDILIVAPSMPVLDLLVEMRESRQHMALVVDEYGGIDGLITIEDLIEEIVGNIQDEHTAGEDGLITDCADGSYLVDARAVLEDFEAQIGRSILSEDEREDVDTLGGMVFSISGRIPARGELLVLPADLEIEVVEADPRRIHRLRIRDLTGAEAQHRP